LAKVDLAALASSMQSTVDHADQLLSSPHLTRTLAQLDGVTAGLERTVRELSQAADELRPTIVEIKTTTAAAHELVAPAGQLSAQIDATLRGIQVAARSVRRLSDQLTRDPGSIVRGGKP